MSATRITYRLPAVGEVSIPLSRSRVLLLLVAANFALLAVDCALGHLIDGTIKLYEWIPVVAGPICALTTLAYGSRRQPGAVCVILLLGGLALAGVTGIVGSAFHWNRALAAAGGSLSLGWDWLVYAPPVAGPLSFTGVALLGFVAALRESPSNSGLLELRAMGRFQAPLTKEQHLLWIVGLGLGAATLSAVLDHARSNFLNPFEWIPIVFGSFATAITCGLATVRRPQATDVTIFFWTMALMLLVGILGFGLHLSSDLSDTGRFSVERVLSRAPLMAPLLFADLGVLGLITLLERVRPEVLVPDP